MTQRIEALEAELEAMRTGLTARRLTIVDDHGERIALGVDEHGAAEIVVMAEPGDRDTALFLQADRLMGELNRGIYIQDGEDAVVMLEVANGRRPRLHLARGHINTDSQP